MLVEMQKLFYSDDCISANAEWYGSQIKLAIRLIDIIIDKVTIIEHIRPDNYDTFDELFKNTKYKLLKYVNKRNFKRFMPYADAIYFEGQCSELFLKELYREKAWYLYNKIRYYHMQEWWD